MSPGRSVGHEKLFDQARNSSPSMGPSTTIGAVNSLTPQGGDKVVVCQSPGVPNRRIDNPWGAAIPSGHVGRGPCFINKHKPVQVHRRLRFSPSAACRLDVLAFLLAGVQGGF